MSITKPIQRVLLAALLLVGLFVTGSVGPKAAYAPDGLLSLARDGAEKDQPVTDGQSLQQALLHTVRHTSPGNAPGGSGHFAGLKLWGTVPAAFPGPGCSKSALKRRQAKLLEHFDYPQYLGLYPEHTFW
jgi:hypothetical protein